MSRAGDRKKLYLVDLDDNETVLKFGQNDILLWEQAGNSKADLQDENKAQAASANFAWATAVRRKIVDCTYEEFLGIYEVFPDEEDMQAVNPKGTK